MITDAKESRGEKTFLRTSGWVFQPLNPADNYDVQFNSGKRNLNGFPSSFSIHLLSILMKAPRTPQPFQELLEQPVLVSLFQQPLNTKRNRDFFSM